MVLAAGDGRRAGYETNKVLLPLRGRPVFVWSLLTAARLSSVVDLAVVVRPQDIELVRAALAEAGLERVRIVLGGATRHGSEWAAIRTLAPRVDSGAVTVIAIHDAARPLAGPALFARAIATAAASGAAIPVVTQTGLAPRDPSGELPAGRVVAVQTPQAFAAEALLHAYRLADKEGFDGTDTAGCIERFERVPVRVIDGDIANIKVTFPEDLLLAEHLLDEEPGPNAAEVTG